MVKYVSKKGQPRTFPMMLMQCFSVFFFPYFLYKSIPVCCWYSFELPQLVKAIQMYNSNIHFYKEVDT